MIVLAPGPVRTVGINNDQATEFRYITIDVARYRSYCPNATLPRDDRRHRPGDMGRRPRLRRRQPDHPGFEHQVKAVVLLSRPGHHCPRARPCLSRRLSCGIVRSGRARRSCCTSEAGARMRAPRRLLRLCSSAASDPVRPRKRGKAPVRKPAGSAGIGKCPPFSHIYVHGNVNRVASGGGAVARGSRDGILFDANGDTRSCPHPPNAC